MIVLIEREGKPAYAIHMTTDDPREAALIAQRELGLDLATKITCIPMGDGRSSRFFVRYEPIAKGGRGGHRQGQNVGEILRISPKLTVCES